MDDAPIIHEPPRWADTVSAWREGDLSPTAAPIRIPPGSSHYPDLRPAWESRAQAGHYQDFRRCEHRNLETWSEQEAERLLCDAASLPPVRGLDEIGGWLEDVARQAGKPSGVMGEIVATLGLWWFGVPADELMHRRGAQRIRDALMRQRAPFSGLAAVFAAATGRGDLGIGAPSFAIAESKGRTRARWNEVACKPTHVGTARAKGAVGIERRADAKAALVGLDARAIDMEALEARLDPKATWDEIVSAYRRRLAWQRGHGWGPSAETREAERWMFAGRRAVDRLRDIGRASTAIEKAAREVERAAKVVASFDDPAFGGEGRARDARIRDALRELGGFETDAEAARAALEELELSADELAFAKLTPKARCRAIGDMAALADMAASWATALLERDAEEERELVAKVTDDVSDKEIRSRVTFLRRRAEMELRRLAPRAEEVAQAYGDVGFAQGLIPPRRERKERERAQASAPRRNWDAEVPA